MECRSVSSSYWQARLGEAFESCLCNVDMKMGVSAVHLLREDLQPSGPPRDDVEKKSCTPVKT